jgi:HSP20 family protein
MAIARWSPISDLLAVHSRMDRLFNDRLTSGRDQGEYLSVASEYYLPMDVYQTDKEWVIRAAVPGADPGSVEVTCEGNTIRISGEIQRPDGVKPENYWLRENFYGKFQRQVTLPEDARCDESQAEFHNGMLVLRVPKDRARAQPKRIPVSAGVSTEAGTGTTSERQLENASRT